MSAVSAALTPLSWIRKHRILLLLDHRVEKTTLALSKKRDEDSDLGGTMRLGKQVVPVKPGTLAAEVYGKEVGERHRHR